MLFKNNLGNILVIYFEKSKKNFQKATKISNNSKTFICRYLKICLSFHIYLFLAHMLLLYEPKILVKLTFPLFEGVLDVHLKWIILNK